jgi:hypothetical protein
MSKIRLPVQEAEYATHLEIEVDYDKGGANYVSGNSEPRGIYLYVRPIAIRDGMVSFLVGHGRKHLLAPMNRLNRKQVDNFAALIAEQVHRPIPCELRTGIAWDMIRRVLAEEKLALLDAPDANFLRQGSALL